MPIFIAKTYDDEIESIVLAKNEDLAVAYWMGKDIYPFSIDVRFETSLENHPTGIAPILSTKVKTIRDGLNSRDFRVIQKN